MPFLLLVQSSSIIMLSEYIFIESNIVGVSVLEAYVS